VTEQCACPETYPEDWVGRIINLGGSSVHEMAIPCLFHMPTGYDIYLRKQAMNIEDLELNEKWPGFVLTRTGWFRGRILRILEDGQSLSRAVTHLPDPFEVCVDLHDGGIGTVTKTVQKQQSKMIDSKLKPKELYLAHLTCPVCAERKGGDRIMVLRRVKS
jgi:hypothetical protein